MPVGPVPEGSSLDDWLGFRSTDRGAELVMLPEVSGYEICQNVRMDPALNDVKILMMTARGSAMERRKGLAMGADGFISKPFELKALRAEVRRILAGEPAPDSDAPGEARHA